MRSLLPDLFTVYGMTAITAFAMAAALWQASRSDPGISRFLAGLSLALQGGAFLALAALLQRSVGVGLPALLWTLAMATYTVALLRFRHSRVLLRDSGVYALPLVASSCLAFIWLPQHTSRFALFHAGVMVLQTVYAGGVLAKLRPRAWGWVLVALSLLVQLLLGLHAFAMPGDGPWNLARPLAKTDVLTGWLICLVSWGGVVLSGTGFQWLLRERKSQTDTGRAQRDPLTQLPNRAALVQHMQRSIAEAAQRQHSLAVMVLDIDHFKSVNDNHGHLVGDQVIQCIAQSLEQHRRSTDFAARYGGEEFVWVLPNTSAREAFRLAEGLCQRVRKQPMTLPNAVTLHLTISIGVYASTPAHGSDWQRLIAAADAAMYTAKRNGRDRVAMSAPIQAVQTTSEVKLV